MAFSKKKKAKAVKSKWDIQRDTLALAVGHAVLAYADISLPYESKGEKPPQEDYQAFKKVFDGLMARYARMIRNKEKWDYE